MLAAGVLAGCGVEQVASGGSTQPSVEQSAPVLELTEEQQESITDHEKMSPEQKSAALEALRHAEESNTGSDFKAVSVHVSDGWAKVAVQETGVPDEEAVGFGVYLRIEDGAWEVAESGTSISAEDLPGAPPGIFKD